MTWFEWKDAPAADFAVIGDPVAHSLSPRMQTAAFQKVGLNYSYIAVRVPQSEFDEAVSHLQSLGFAGLNVTVPLKLLALKWCAKTDAERYGAVNTLRLADRAGTNTDAPGFLQTLRDREISPCKALVLGAGGSARALCQALSEEGFELRVWNRTTDRAVAMVEESGVRAIVLDEPDPADCDLIVNMTASGLNRQELTIAWTNANQEAMAYDLWYTQGLTPFLQDAHTAGLKVCDGRALLVAQGALSFKWWTGLEAPQQAMMDAVK